MATPTWISHLNESEAEDIVVLDNDYAGEPKQRKNILYLSPPDASTYMNKFDSVMFFKSLYGYPGRGSNMSSLYKEPKKDFEE